MKKIFFILALVIISHTALAENTLLKEHEQKLTECTNKYITEYDKCPDEEFTKCYYHRMTINQNTQECYKKIAIELLKEFYSLSKDDAESRFDTFKKEIYNQYSFVFWETNYCKKNNCGLEPYLHSEDATTEQLNYYINKLIVSIKSRIQ